MKRVIIVHRWSGSPGKDWLLWLKAELIKKGYEVLAPEMPDADYPVMEKWVGRLAEVIGENEPNKETYFIGHSMGCQTIMRYLDARIFKSLETVGGAIFVAGWFNLKNLEDKETEEIAKPWLENPINLGKVKAVLPKSTLIISDNDPFGCFEENKNKFSELGSKIITLHEAGHITAEDGFTEFPLVLSELQNLQKSF
ncbi:MAG: alpha/beta hydrolase [Minisyncoccia bacterium]